jgi:hypothetical protein
LKCYNGFMEENGPIKKPEKEHKMSYEAFFFMGVFAVICDLIGMIPFANNVVDTIFWLIASAYFYFAGLGIFNGKKLAVMLSSWIIGMVPFLGNLPIELTAGIIALFIMTRLEEKTGISISSAINPSKKALPLNSNGLRLPQKTASE